MFRRDFVHQPSRSTPQAEEQHFFPDLNSVNMDDMDCTTRHDRLRTLTIIKRGHELTEIEKAPLGELEAKGTRVHGWDLSRMNVADMDTVTRKTRRAVLRKKVDGSEVLNAAEMKQLQYFECCFTRKVENRKCHWRAWSPPCVTKQRKDYTNNSSYRVS